MAELSQEDRQYILQQIEKLHRMVQTDRTINKLFAQREQNERILSKDSLRILNYRIKREKIIARKQTKKVNYGTE